MSDRQVYSYHTFLYPFLWDNGGAVKMDAFREMLREGWEQNALAIFGIGFTLITAFSACIDLRAFLETFGWESTVELSKLTIKIVALIIGPAFILAVGVMSWKKKE